MNLDLVLGLSCYNQSSVTTDKSKGLIAYPASGVLVIFQPKLNAQIAYLRVRKNAISCASFSPDGQYIVTGERGYRPVLRVWSVEDAVELASLPGHEFGIKAVLWAPRGDYIVSVGEEYDNEVNLWSWPACHRRATNKIKDCIHAVAYSECSSFFVTVGVRHLKFWYPNHTLAAQDTSSKVPFRDADPHPVVPLYGRPATLGVFKNNIFLDVCCGNRVCDKFVYVISKTGNVIILNSARRDVCCQKTLPGDKVTSVYVLRQIIFLGTESGLIHLMSALSLQHLATLPVPAHFHNKLNMHSAVFTMVFNPSTRALTAVYTNTSLCVWDLGDGLNIKQSFRGVFPVDCVTDLHVVPHSADKHVFRDTLVTVSHNFHVQLWSVSTSDVVTLEKLNILASEVETPTVGNVDATYQRRNSKTTEKSWCTYCWNQPSKKCNFCYNQTQNNHPKHRDHHENDFIELTSGCNMKSQINHLNNIACARDVNNAQPKTIVHNEGSLARSPKNRTCLEITNDEYYKNETDETGSNNSDSKLPNKEPHKKPSPACSVETKAAIERDSQSNLDVPIVNRFSNSTSTVNRLSNSISTMNRLSNSSQNNNEKDGLLETDCQPSTEVRRNESPRKLSDSQSNNKYEMALNPNNSCQDENTLHSTEVASDKTSETDIESLSSEEPNKITTVLICKGHPECHGDFHHIVTGNTVGNISAHDAASFKHHVTVMCHNRDVTSLAFYADSHGRMTLLSGGRDRLIHVMDARGAYRLVRTLDIHSSSINALRTVMYRGEAYLISCGADRSLKMCIANNSQEEGRRDVSLFQLSKAQVGVSTPHDLAVSLQHGELAAAYQDGYVRVFGLLSLQGLRVYKGCRGNECQVTQIALCQHGVLLISAASDRTINVINFKTGAILASMAGHHKMVTGLSFSSSGDYVISAAMDGCIFFWRMSQKLKDFQMERSNSFDCSSPPPGHSSKAFGGFYLLDQDLNVEKVSVGPENNYDIITLDKTKAVQCRKTFNKR